MTNYDHLQVTAEQLRQAHEHALRTHPDPASVQANLNKILADLNGDWDTLAGQFTRENLLEAFRAQIRPAVPEAPEPRSNTAADKERLRELVARFPDLAREILGDNL